MRQYFGSMISTARLKESLDGDWVAFDERGEPLEIEIPKTIGPAALLVSPVTDAVKRVDGAEVESLDRDRMWAVEAIVLNRVVVLELEDVELEVQDFLEAVRDLGHSWQISPISSL